MILNSGYLIPPPADKPAKRIGGQASMLDTRGWKAGRIGPVR
jgi:hypothetical protein